MSVKRPIPGRLYRFKRDGKFFVPIRPEAGGGITLTGAEFAVWRCLTSGGTETLWLWSGSYDLVEGE